MPTDKARVSQLQARHRDRNLAHVLEFLATHHCTDCGESDPVVLDFDHLPGTRKSFDVGRALSGSTRSWNAILDEIQKCEVVCANCHRRRTAARANFRKHQRANWEPDDLEARPRRTVEHGGGAKGKHNCACAACRARRREYQANLRSRTRPVPPEGFEPPAMRVETACSSTELRGDSAPAETDAVLRSRLPE